MEKKNKGDMETMAEKMKGRNKMMVDAGHMDELGIMGSRPSMAEGGKQYPEATIHNPKIPLEVGHKVMMHGVVHGVEHDEKRGRHVAMVTIHKIGKHESEKKQEHKGKKEVTKHEPKEGKRTERLSKRYGAEGKVA